MGFIRQPDLNDLRDGLVAGGVAGIASGAPSTLYALATGRDPLEATLAAGSLLLPATERAPSVLAAALPVHLALSVGWALVLAATLPRRGTTAAGAAAGLGIAALDLGVIGRRAPRIRALPLGPQVADHVIYGGVVGAMVAHRRARRADAREEATALRPRHGSRAPVSSSREDIAANAHVAAPADEVFDFLSDLENHWLVADRFIEVVSLDRPGGGAATGGRVLMRGPLGLRRTAATRVVEAEPPRRMSGTAVVGRRTRARITWTLSAVRDGHGTDVRLAAAIDAAGPLDRALLVLGGRGWLEARFAGALAVLADRWR